jgi:hypothetical protein
VGEVGNGEGAGLTRVNALIFTVPSVEERQPSLYNRLVGSSGQS